MTSEEIGGRVNKPRRRNIKTGHAPLRPPPPGAAKAPAYATPDVHHARTHLRRVEDRPRTLPPPPSGFLTVHSSRPCPPVPSPIAVEESRFLDDHRSEGEISEPGGDSLASDGHQTRPYKRTSRRGCGGGRKAQGVEPWRHDEAMQRAKLCWTMSGM